MKTIADNNTKHSDLVSKIYATHGNSEFERLEKHTKEVAELNAIIAKFRQPIPPVSAFHIG
jgi:hypothetical protein